MKNSINLFKVTVPDNLDLVIDTIRSGYIAEGPRVKEFQEKISPFVGNEFVVALNSGTSSIHLALVLAGVGKGGKVISTPITSPATNVSIANLGAEIIWADVDENSGNISPESVRRLISKYGEEVKAVIAVDWGGYPCDYDNLRDAIPEEVYLIEDAAHAITAEYKKRKVGSIADITCFSFQAIKHITTGDGGLICCLREDDFLRANRLKWFGIDRNRENRGWQDDIYESGFKFHMNDIAATMGLLQLPRLPQIVERRRRIAEIYEKTLIDLGVDFQQGNYQCKSSYWLFTLMIDSRTDFIDSLNSQGIEASPVHRRNDTYTAFKGSSVDRDDLEGVEKFDQRMVCIPVGDWLSDEDVNQVIKALEKGW